MPEQVGQFVKIVCSIIVHCGFLSGQREEVCFYESLDARCPQGNVIFMEHALFGRMKPTVCYSVGQRDDYSHCTTDVLSLTDQMCSGKQTCQIQVPNEKFDAVMP